MGKKNKDKVIKIGTINVNLMGRDYVHMREITHGSGAGFHKTPKDYSRKQSRKIERQSNDWRSDCLSHKWETVADILT